MSAQMQMPPVPESPVQDAVLSVRNLEVGFRTGDGELKAVKGVSLDVAKGETLAIVGESGSGKSQTMMAVMGLLASNGFARGSVKVGGDEILGLSPRELNRYRGSRMGMIFQEPMTSLDPLYKIGRQLEEPLRAHTKLSRAEARTRALEMLTLVGIPRPKERLDSYPHELSGGQRQRVMIAMALANRPEVLIADEPTTALDVTIQAQILELLADLKSRFGMSIVFITHDLGIVRRFADRVVVMKSGEVVETGETEAVFSAPRQAYTRMLLAAEPTGRKAPPPKGAPVLVEARDVRVTFRLRGDFFGRGASNLHAVDGVDLALRRGGTIGVVGKSGSGKSTLGRAILRFGAVIGCDPLRGPQPDAARPRADAALAQGVAARLPGSVRFALASDDRRRDHHRGAAGARTGYQPRRARQSCGSRAGGGEPRSRDPEPLSA